jgi:hypothetical protein
LEKGKKQLLPSRFWLRRLLHLKTVGGI